MLLKGMQFANRWAWAGVSALVATALSVAVPTLRSQSSATVKIDGSSTVYPITEAIAEEFQKANGGSTRVTVGISGTGGGFKKFCTGEMDISNASRPIKPSEQEQCKAAGISYIELPVAYDAITVVVNPQNTWVDNMSPAELKKMWQASSQGNVTKWSDIRSGWPNEQFTLFGPGADSGTFDYFNEEILGDNNSSRTDYTPSEDDNVLVQGVARNKNALGYFGYAYYDANKSRIKSVKINGVAPSPETVNNGSYKPLSRPIYIYVSTKAAQRPEVKAFVEYYLNNAPKYVREVAYVPLPAADYKMAMERFQKGQTGRVPLRAGL
ncbi:MAG: PstS family phosphate ABC transporter substrate-binding protein [Limnospira sp.]